MKFNNWIILRESKNTYSHAIIMADDGTQILYHVVPHSGNKLAGEGGYRAQRSVKEPGDIEFSELDYSHHPEFDDAKSQIIRTHDLDLKQGGGKSKKVN